MVAGGFQPGIGALRGLDTVSGVGTGFSSRAQSFSSMTSSPPGVPCAMPTACSTLTRDL